MASTYSSSLKIELIGVGDQTDAWGSTTNTNFQYALEEAIVGYATATFPSDNNYDWGALYVNSAGSQAQRNLVIQVTGTITATRNFIVPTIEKQYIIYNATTGGQSILVKTSAGTGITVPNGVRAHLYVDGVNVVSMLDYIPSLTAGSLALTTALPVASGGTGAITAQAAMNTFAGAVTAGQYLRGNGTNVVMSGLLAGDLTGTVAVANGGTGQTTAQAAINSLAGAVTSGQYLRGNGTNVVMSAIQAGDVPTLNQNTTGTAGNVTGVVALANGGTGATSANAALNALLPAQGSNAGKYLTTDGTNSSWGTIGTGVTTFSAGTTGLTPNTATSGAVTLAGTLAVANGGTGQTSLASVSVGTATNIAGGAANRIPYNTGAGATAFIAAPTTSAYLQWTGSAFTWSSITATPAGSTGDVQYNNGGAFGASSSFTFSSNHLFVNTVKIGRGSGTNTTLSTAVGATSLNSVTTGSANTMFGYGAGDSLQGGSENTGIGWDACGGPVSTDNNTAVGSQALAYATGAGNTMVGARCGSGSMTGSDNTGLGSGAFSNSTVAGSNNIAIGAGGVLQGLTSGSNNTFVGAVAGNTFASGSNTAAFGYNAQPSTTSVSNEITLGNSSIATLRCQVTTITAISDARDKTNIADIPMGLNFVNTLRPVSFDWNMRDGAKVGVTEFGFIAQDLKKAQEDFGTRLPGLVHDANPDRLEAAPGTLIPVLVKAVQELSAQVEDLKRQLAAR